MPSYLTTGTVVPYPQPSLFDFELAVRMLSGAALRPSEEARARCPDAALAEAIHRVEHCMHSQIAAARAALLALTPEAIQALGDLLISQKETVKLNAVRLWGSLALPAAPVEVKHSIAPEDRQMVGQAASDFHRLTNELVDKLKDAREAKTIDITQSKHVHRGSAARPIPGILERPSDPEAAT
jgi:hypothetical protein